MKNIRVNPLVRTDSYKIVHHMLYPDNMTSMFDYIEARVGGKWDKTVFFGLQAFIKRTLLVPWTMEDVEEADQFYNQHFPPVYANKLFNREEFEYIVNQYDGIPPVKIWAVPEGSLIPVDNALVSIESTDPKCPSIVSFLETIMLRDIWYGCTVATNSYNMKKIIKYFGDLTSDNTNEWINFALHDFGARGTSSQDSAIMGGMAHLTQFMGSDTLEAIYASNDIYSPAGGMSAFSIPASEHSVMCSLGKDGEYDVVKKIFDAFCVKDGIFAIVNDTYDMTAHVRWVCENMKERLISTGARWVTRPDSGVPVESVLRCLHLLDYYFGSTTNAKGYKVLHPCVRVIQGDGIDAEEIRKILTAVAADGFSTENVAFGCGGGLLQKVNRDTQRFAMKASSITLSDGTEVGVYKQPATDLTKKSKSGKVRLYEHDKTGEFYTVSDEEYANHAEKNSLQPVMDMVYTNGEIVREQTIDDIREISNLELSKELNNVI